ncbi:hypothetical protein GU926_08185 [Nibribacter ruber]|uniref:Uncharacterized protein n=1 Tax=Nibribacter ruber TaxID=2698458 RepID=A0A6P1NYE8_9BACT|nr:hypothetical protein [Nibribacter ruber]QHL87414.1 hypothetical protein GU926_08185 [Nibribacter ruber]
MKGKGIIRLADALEKMEEGEPFDIVHFTANEKKQTGGERKVRRGVTMTSVGRKGKTNSAETQEDFPVDSESPAKSKKNPNHFANATRNIILGNGQTRTVHLFLITQFNDLKVII